ncbi:NAD(P)H-hydrate dehydratase [Vibrio maerlii]|uniref:NAD(P)H-hydrate dehydratase n=1 Tax=Vibrio maerlii TaxID=2231648 RepID=UPI000E3D5A1C|nr:NAD(P)H-hydrate dehydratase [Vibrio maerlii]
MLPTTTSQSLPEQLYLSSTVREREREAVNALNIEMFELMQRAGQAVFDVIDQRYSHCRHILVVTGKGNNGGDGYVIARLAMQSGYTVSLWQFGDHHQLSGDANRAKQLYLDAGGIIESPKESLNENIELIVDGILGTGITGSVRPNAQEVIELINQSELPVVAIDTPSGLNTDTGKILGCAIRAEITVTFIAMKLGTVTGQARRCTGEILFAGLGVDNVFIEQNLPTALLTNEKWLKSLKTRDADSHKGSHGKLLIVGGDDGMSGAVYFASAAALRSGAGLGAVVCHPSSANPIRSLLPEAMVADQTKLSARLGWCSAICVGVGLGRDAWGGAVYKQVEEHVSINKQIPIVIDADGLSWLAKSNENTRPSGNIIITPHPGEAAMLLDCTISEVEADRFHAAKALCLKYQCITVLKGAGTLVCDGENTVVCHAGNAGMATGGTGDVLAGVITSLLGQGYTPMHAATLGTLIHSLAADDNAEQFGQVGMLASDLLPSIRRLINQR